MYSPRTPIPINWIPLSSKIETIKDGYPLTGLPKNILSIMRYIAKRNEIKEITNPM